MLAHTPRTLLFSTRGFRRWKIACDHVEAEDCIAEIDDVHLLAPEPRPRHDRGLGRLLSRGLRHFTDLDVRLRRLPETTRIEQDYDLFFFRIASLRDLRLLKRIPDWRKRCLTAICWIDELWHPQLSAAGSRATPDAWLDGRAIAQLEAFDHVVVPFRETVAPLAERIRTPVHWLPFAVDTLRFNPWPAPPPRTIDFLAMGRKSPATHRAIEAYASAHDWLYLHDTLHVEDVYDVHEHRHHLVERLQRTTWFLANRAKVNCPDETGGQHEMGFRFFEGAAAGAILVGALPATAAFARCFDWRDAAFDLPWDATDVADVFDLLQRDPERRARISRENVRQCLRRHDWAHRWADILALAELPPRPGLHDRLQRLERAAAAIPEPHTATTGSACALDASAAHRVGEQFARATSTVSIRA
ncbi:glycosyltransferase family protein [Congregicoccus parvus]|uniref:glycosyltransferase family protein n=1 Tax=Congregicoccus parvus TaxID=3081749 RepID=UPI003FA55659